MALPMNAAPARFDHTSENATTGKLATTSRNPKQATVEDYFSDDLQQLQIPSHVSEDPKGSTEPQRKPIIGNPSTPKRANVSWLDEVFHPPEPSDSRTSRLYEALTAVPSGLDGYDRSSIGRSPHLRDNVRGPSTRVPDHTSASSQRRTRDEGIDNGDLSDPSNSSEDDDWYHRYPEVTSANSFGRPSNPHYYTGLTTGDDRVVNERNVRRRHPWALDQPDSEPWNHYPAYVHPYRRDLAPTLYQPWLHPRLDPFTGFDSNPFQLSKNSRIPEPTIYGELAPQGPHYNYHLPSWSYGEDASLPPPPPPPAIMPAKRAAESGPDKDDASSVPQNPDLVKHGQVLAVGTTEKTDKYKDFMHSLEQTLDRYNPGPERPKQVKLASIDPIATMEPPSADGSQAQLPALSDMDLIKLMEERMQALKQKNEKKLIEANQVLEYLNRSSEKEQRTSDEGNGSLKPGGVAGTYSNVLNVHSFRTPEAETDLDDVSDEAYSTDHDSVAGNSSGSSSSSLGERTHPINLSRRVIVNVQDQSTTTDALDAMVDESLSSDHSDHESVASGSESSHDLSETNENDQGCVTTGPLLQPVLEAHTEHDMVGEIVALRRDLFILKRQMTRKNKSWFGKTLSASFIHCKKLVRRLPRPGTQRLEWTCECGDEMYADLPVENGAQYQQMLEFLTRPGPQTQQGSENRTTPSQLEGGTAQLGYSSLQSSQSSFVQGTAPASTIGSGSTYVGSGSSQFPAAQQNNPYARNKYLELCVNVGKYETKLAEIQVSSSQSNGAAICTDAHLFRQIYHRYFALRKQTWRRFLYRPAGIKFVHFGVQAGYRVSFFSSDPLPSDDEIAAKRYEYSLQPPVPPPIDSRTFLHYFYKHNAHSHSTSAKYVNRLPKKLGDSLTRSLGVDDLLEGWGIHIIEGPNKVAICWALMIVLIASLGVSIGYDLVTRSGDSGFAIGQWMVAALTVALSALYFSLEDDVSSNFD